jgi:AcrR family transcriptional regulator
MEGTDREGRRRRRIERRQHQILGVAARIFAEKGYGAATTKEIAEAADIAEGTLYHYFSGKREILIRIAADMQGTMRDLLKDMDQIRSREDMIALIERAYDDVATKLPFIRAFLAETWVDDELFCRFAQQHVQRIVQEIERFVARSIERGLFRKVEPAVAAQIMMGALIAPISPALRGLGGFPPPRERTAIASAVVDLLLDGLRARPPEERP